MNASDPRKITIPLRAPMDRELIAASARACWRALAASLMVSAALAVWRIERCCDLAPSVSFWFRSKPVFAWSSETGAPEAGCEGFPRQAFILPELP